MQFKDNAFSIKFMKVVREIVRQELEKIHKVRIVTVDSIDRTASTCYVTFVEAPNAAPIRVKMGAVQPRQSGQIVRIESYDGDWFVTTMLADPSGDADNSGAYYIGDQSLGGTKPSYQTDRNI